MLQIRNGAPQAVEVPLGGGATAVVRPATHFETSLAVAKAARILSKLLESEEAAASVAIDLGESHSHFVAGDRDWLNAASERLVLIELAALCVTSWSGVVDEDCQAIEKPTRESLSLVLRTAAVADSITGVLRRNVNIEVDEGKGSAVSPIGVGEAATNTAQTARPSEQPAQSG